MKIYVLVKQVPDTETNIKVSGTSIDENGVKWIVSPFDENALEEALRLREKTGGEITAVSFGPARVAEALRTAYALGVNRAVHIQDDSYNVLDIGYAAAVLAGFLKKESPDVVLTGSIAADSQSAMVPGMIAEALGCVSVNNTIELNIDGDKASCKRDIEGGTATMEASLPVVITATKNLNDPRYPSLKGIMAAKKKKIEVIPASEIEGAGNIQKVEVVGLELPPPRPPGRIIEGATPEEKAKELVKLLKEEAKVI